MVIGKPVRLLSGRIVDAQSVFNNGKFVGTTTYQSARLNKEVFMRKVLWMLGFNALQTPVSNCEIITYRSFFIT